MANRGLSISVRLILGSTLLLVVVIGLFSVVDIMQSRRIINDSSHRLRDRIIESLQQAGKGQLRLLMEAARIAIVQSDYNTLQAIVQNVGRDDKRVTVAWVGDTNGNILAHTNPRETGRRISDIIKTPLIFKEMKVIPEIIIDGHKSIAFAAPVVIDNRIICIAFLAYRLVTLETELATTSKQMHKEITATLVNTSLVGLVAVLLGILLTIIQGLRLSKPIRALARQADRMANGDLQARVNITSFDEFGLLGDRFNYMAQQMQSLIQETMAKATLEKELEVASTIQATLIPDSNTVDFPAIKFAGYFKPATHCGGDWWKYYSLPENRTLILIGDVTGHGVGSAMITAAAQGAVSTIMAMTEGHVDLRRLLRTMNSAIYDTARGKFVMTCFATIYDPQKGQLLFANAGHNFPYLYETANRKLVSLVARGNRLGDIIDSDYEVQEISVNPNDSLFWYTDGIIDCEEPLGSALGERRFRELLQKYAGFAPNQAVVEIIGAATEFFQGTPQKDDITLVVGKIKRLT